MEATLFGYELIFSIFKITLPHKFIPIEFAQYRLKELLQKENTFANKSPLNPAEVIIACNNFSYYLLDLNKPL